MIWPKMGPIPTKLASAERTRGALETGKHRVITDVRDFLDVMKAFSCLASHRRDFGLPYRAEYKGAMVWERPRIKC